MTIDSTNAAAKQVTFQFTDQEWDILQWLNTHRSPAKFVEWLEAQMAVMGQRKEEELKTDIKRAWQQADAATKAQIQTLLGV